MERSGLFLLGMQSRKREFNISGYSAFLRQFATSDAIIWRQFTYGVLIVSQNNTLSLSVLRDLDIRDAVPSVICSVERTRSFKGHRRVGNDC